MFQTPLRSPCQSHDTFNALAEGLELTRRTFTYFYCTDRHQFCSPHNEPGTVNEWHGYVVWPVAICFWALADTAHRSKSPQDLEALALAYEAMEKHWNPHLKGYCAWVYFQGNKDVYYDDNAHCGNALLTAYEATGEEKYRQRALDILVGLVPRGWDKSGNPGGIAWHFGKEDESRNACSTLSIAMLACRMALYGVEKTYCMELAGSCLEFSMQYLFADDGLILDAIHRRPGGQWETDQRKFTYNSGFAISSFLLWYELTEDTQYLEKATKLSLATVNTSCTLFNHTIPIPSQRIWNDPGFFVHHLVDALISIIKSCPNSEISAVVGDYLVRLATYCRRYIFDLKDEMYFRNLTLYFIDQAHADTFNEVFGTHQMLHAKAGEREKGDGPVASRRLIKTLLGCASMARIFLSISDLYPSISL